MGEGLHIGDEWMLECAWSAAHGTERTLDGLEPREAAWKLVQSRWHLPWERRLVCQSRGRTCQVYEVRGSSVDWPCTTLATEDFGDAIGNALRWVLIWAQKAAARLVPTK